MLSFNVASRLNQQQLYREIHQAKQQTREILRVQLAQHEREKQFIGSQERIKVKNKPVGSRLDVVA